MIIEGDPLNTHHAQPAKGGGGGDDDGDRRRHHDCLKQGTS